MNIRGEIDESWPPPYRPAVPPERVLTLRSYASAGRSGPIGHVVRPATRLSDGRRQRSARWGRLLGGVFAPLAVLALAGCASTPLPVPHGAVPPHFEATSTGHGSAQALDRWWLLFNDAQLTSLIDQGLASAPDARTAFARLREAEATRRGALAPYDLQGNPTASISRSDTGIFGAPAQSTLVGHSTTLAANFNVSWELDLFGRRAVPIPG